MCIHFNRQLKMKYEFNLIAQIIPSCWLFHVNSSDDCNSHFVFRITVHFGDDICFQYVGQPVKLERYLASISILKCKAFWKNASKSCRIKETHLNAILNSIKRQYAQPRQSSLNWWQNLHFLCTGIVYVFLKFQIDFFLWNFL